VLTRQFQQKSPSFNNSQNPQFSLNMVVYPKDSLGVCWQTVSGANPNSQQIPDFQTIQAIPQFHCNKYWSVFLQ